MWKPSGRFGEKVAYVLLPFPKVCAKKPLRSPILLCVSNKLNFFVTTDVDPQVKCG